MAKNLKHEQHADWVGALEGLVIDLQKEVVEAVQKRAESKDDTRNWNHYDILVTLYAGVISKINKRFGTRYEDLSYNLMIPKARERPQYTLDKKE